MLVQFTINLAGDLWICVGPVPLIECQPHSDSGVVITVYAISFFSARQHIAYMLILLSSVRLFVCPSRGWISR